MAISDDDYTAWLKDERKDRCILVEWTYFQISPPETKKAYFSNIGYISELHRIYPERIIGNVSYRASIGGKKLIGLGSGSWSSIFLDNSDFELDFMWQSRADGESVRVLIGDASWELTDFREILKAFTFAAIPTKEKQIEIQIRTLRYLLDANLNKNIYPTGDLNAGSPHPVSIGPCSNISPLKIEVGASD